jgi:anti-sigma factor RsiW
MPNAMNHRATPPLDESVLHTLADARLPPHEAQALQARLEPAHQAQVAQWRVQRQRLQALWPEAALPPPSAALQAAAERLQARQQSEQSWWHWGGMAAGWLLAFGLGWLVHGQWPSATVAPGPLAQAGQASAAQQFAQQAAVAHAVYQPEQRHPVEVTADQQQHLVQWLSKRLGRPLQVPVLQAQGYELVGGRLLPGEAGARAQFMYQNTAGLRITLYLGALETPEAQAQAQTGFHFRTDGPVPGFYWADQGFGYALSGELPRAALLALATAVYQQLPRN